MMIDLKCVIFDMDGVIVNTEPLHRKAYFKTFDWLEINVSDELYHSLTGASTINTFQKIKNQFELEMPAKEMVIYKRKEFVHLFETDTDLTLIDGVLDIIQYFHNKGLNLVLASSAAMVNIERIFKRFDLNQYFVGKLSGADLAQSKPHPEIFEKAAEMGKTSKENCIVIEDSDNGIKAANSAGIFSIGFQSENSHLQSLSGAKLKIEEFKELKELF